MNDEKPSTGPDKDGVILRLRIDNCKLWDKIYRAKDVLFRDGTSHGANEALKILSEP